MEENEKAIYFDMDGTITDLYGVPNWLDMLRAANPAPYELAPALLHLSTLARLLNRLQKSGYTIGIVSWLAKDSDASYDQAVLTSKVEWLHRHLHSVSWDEIHIVKHGTPKHTIVNYPNGILFDDEEKNRKNWTGTAYTEDKIIEVLKNLLSN